MGQRPLKRDVSSAAWRSPLAPREGQVSPLAVWSGAPFRQVSANHENAPDSGRLATHGREKRQKLAINERAPFCSPSRTGISRGRGRLPRANGRTAAVATRIEEGMEDVHGGC